MNTNTDALEALRIPFEEYLAEISSVTVETAEQYEAAAFGLKKLKTWEADIAAHFEPDRKRTYDAYNAVTTAKSSYLNKTASVEKIIKAKMAAYVQAENETRRLAQIEADRATREAQKELEGTAPTPESPVVVSSVIIPDVPQPTKVAGISVTNTWKYTITDVNAIRKEFWVLDEALILKTVKALGPDAVRSVGGIEVFPDVVVGSRRG